MGINYRGINITSLLFVSGLNPNVRGCYVFCKQPPRGIAYQLGVAPLREIKHSEVGRSTMRMLIFWRGPAVITNHDQFLSFPHEDISPSSLLAFFFFLLILRYTGIGVLNNSNAPMDLD